MAEGRWHKLSERIPRARGPYTVRLEDGSEMTAYMHMFNLLWPSNHCWHSGPDQTGSRVNPTHWREPDPVEGVDAKGT